MKRRSRDFAIGLTAIGLGAGAVAMAPTVAGAQSEAPSPEPQVAEESHASPHRGADRLADVVAEGIISQDQADAIADHFAEKRAERREAMADTRANHEDGEHEDRGKRGQRNRGERSDVVTDLLGLTAEEMRDAMRGGQTLGELAEANGVTRDALTAALLTGATERLDAAVEAGRLTQEQADARLTKITERVNERLDTAPGEQRRGHGREAGRGGR